FTPKIYALIKGMAPEPPEEKITEVVMAPPPPINPEVQTPPPVEPPPPKQDQIKFPPPIVKPDNQVTDEKPPTVEDLKKADPGQKT
ncbi:UNVERIFIED_CONTAM: energy transducer TonB, partial [Salmonella enterica subsp. enterica serovar Weltevreden]